MLFAVVNFGLIIKLFMTKRVPMTIGLQMLLIILETVVFVCW